MPIYIVISDGKAYGTYSDVEEAEADITTLKDRYGYHAVVMPVAKINWDKLAVNEDLSQIRTKTKEILLELFPTVGTIHPAQYVKDFIINTPGTTAKASYLSIIRRELGITSKPHRTKGILGVQYWEWVREFPGDQQDNANDPQAPRPAHYRTKENNKRNKAQEQQDTTEEFLDDDDLIFIPDHQVWIQEKHMQEYLADPESYTGYLERES